MPSRSYVALSTAGMSGSDLVREAGGGIVAVELEYRLGVFGEAILFGKSKPYVLMKTSRLPPRNPGKEKRSIECRYT